MQYAVQRWPAVTYNGANSAQFVSVLETYEIASEAGGVLTLKSNYVEDDNRWQVTVGMVACMGNLYTPAGFAQFFHVLPGDLGAEVVASSAMQTALAAASRAGGAIGLASVPSLLGSASTTVQVPITPSLPDTAYTAAAVISGEVSLLAALSVTAVTKVSGLRVDVTVRNTGLVTLSGAKVLVHCS